MRIKALTKYNFSTIRNSLIIFYLCYMGATLIASVINASTSNNTVVLGVTGKVGGTPQTWSSSILAFSIFILISSLTGSQKETRFLITRSVSRKEIFVSYAVFLCPLAAVMSVMQIICIYADGFVRWLFHSDWRGLALDFQIMQAPDMNNILVFFAVSFSILLAFGAVSYLFGSLMARWKIQTIVVVCVLSVMILALIGSTNIIERIIDLFTFMFLDETTGLLIAFKQIVFAIIVMIIAFPVMRKTTIAK